MSTVHAERLGRNFRNDPPANFGRLYFHNLLYPVSSYQVRSAISGIQSERIDFADSEHRNMKMVNLKTVVAKMCSLRYSGFPAARGRNCQ
jgi:hypothetical protein